jgi:hypothetical protein
VEFEDVLDRHGFSPAPERRGRDARQYVATPNQYMTFSVHAYADGTALFTWEFAVAEYLANRGIQVGDGEILNLFMYPSNDERGRQDGAWLTAVLDRADALLRSLDFAQPDG